METFVVNKLNICPTRQHFYSSIPVPPVKYEPCDVLFGHVWEALGKDVLQPNQQPSRQGSAIVDYVVRLDFPAALSFQMLELTVDVRTQN